MGRRITLARFTNVKRLREVEVHPEADILAILIAGMNAQGKSSLLDAFRMALEGRRAAPAEPVRRGADKAALNVVFDDGLEIKRVLSADGKHDKLEVREHGSVIKSPQTRLDELIGACFLDPVAFLQLHPTKQRAKLLEMFDKDGAIAKLDARHDLIYNKRTEVGRDLKKAQGELARLPPATKVAAPIDVAALSAERAVFADKQRAGDGLGSAHREAKGKLDHAQAELTKTEKLIAQLEEQLAEAMDCRDGWAKEIEARGDEEAKLRAKVEVARKDWADTTPRREQLDADLKRAGEHNRAVFEAEASNKRRAAAEATVAQIEEQVAGQTELLKKIDAQKLELLAAANLPDGVGITAEGITFNGVPFDQSSAAERLRVALGLAMAASPELDDIWVRDGSLLDDESLELVQAMAEKAGKRAWIERVGTRDPGAIVIHDGTIVEEAERVAG